MPLNRVMKDDPVMQKDREESLLVLPVPISERMEWIVKSYDDPDYVGDRVAEFVEQSGFYLLDHDIEVVNMDIGIGIKITPNW